MSVSHAVLQAELKKSSLFKQLNIWDLIWAVLVAGGAYVGYHRYGEYMNVFQVGILAGVTIGTIALSTYWRSLRWLIVVVAVASLSAIALYGEDLGRREHEFFLRFLISSQAAIMWMSALYVMATLAYFAGIFARSGFASKVGTAMTWSATAMGLIGLMVRWRESYLMGLDIGHIPLSNLYDVFILFSIVTALIYLYYEMYYRTRSMGGFVLLIISAAIAFLLWYQFGQHASQIEPLVPALQSYWMKMHVPANFIGYGSFAIAAMVGTLHLLIDYAKKPNRALGYSILGLTVIAAVIIGWLADGVHLSVTGISLGYGVVVAAVMWGFGTMVMMPRVADNMPPREMLDDVMYKAIGLGFAFFTLATILGSLWAEQAWGGYWSWDPKETWALIVWLNYAAWLHMRLTKGWRGAPMAWWALIGLFITLFAFLGVNMFLSGLHSYGTL